MEVKNRYIGKIYTPFKKGDDIPRQSIAWQKTRGKIEIYPEFVEGLNDLDKFSHIYVIFRFHKNDSFHLSVRPPGSKKQRGLFATRSPHRPAGIGLSIYKIDKIEDNVIFVEGVDVIDNTPVLDIKPYVPKVDIITDAKVGDI
ncbi:MAG: tRNA (N6-threonylcarbamoyladenosine(37)-N6)-methyltransferase TrmO [Candidatus Cloacimonetes bacterium]|nr:tRNA (N6-threonylcarbamoyladenosine(37)-N6)-methyltransferase TrmO [Candidatus Cloacimonadota bacterium]MBS3767907.1 tRNA (N6-threonylcarbamoyladenosine(37)-N6)-methyltransferase TrmO [Candidatus Cloacimonadota bacterium]